MVASLSGSDLDILTEGSRRDFTFFIGATNAHMPKTNQNKQITKSVTAWISKLLRILRNYYFTNNKCSWWQIQAMYMNREMKIVWNYVITLHIFDTFRNCQCVHQQKCIIWLKWNYVSHTALAATTV
jgi:hypothetical protein